MNIPHFRQRASQMLILAVLVLVSIVVLLYTTKSWPNNFDLFPHIEHEEKFVKLKNDTTVEEKNNRTFNFFTKQLPKNDENRLVNLTDFDYKINKKNLCHNESVLLLVVVSSAPGHQLQRKVIRETWGREDNEVKIVFMLGDINNPNVTAAIQTEHVIFNDIIQGNFLDSYRNMTYKSTLGLKYAIYYCATAKFIMKCDDDVLVNMPMVKNFLKNDMRVIDSTNSIFCTVNHARTPIRDSVGELRKWYVSYEEWPEEMYPLYCAGWYAIMPVDVAFDIYQHAQNSTFFWIDDVFLTGIAAKNVLGLKYVDTSRLTLADIEIDRILNGDLGDMPFLVGSLNMAPEHIQKLWQYVLLRPVSESIIYSLIQIYQNLMEIYEN